jgi:hypothetical protein
MKEILKMPEDQVENGNESKDTDLAKVEKAIEDLPRRETSLAVENVELALPQAFYEGASHLVVSPDERNALAQYEDASDEEIDIRPDGLVYVGHMFYRRALNRIFGPGRWVLMPGSRIQTEVRGDAVKLYQRWVLVIDGHYVGEAIGSATYWRTNMGQDQSDAAEAAASNAIMRICAKSLGIGSNPWNRREAERWRKQYAKQVWVTIRSQREKRWRRIDADALEGEIGDVPIKQDLAGSQGVKRDVVLQAQNATPIPPNVTGLVRVTLAEPSASPPPAGSKEPPARPDGQAPKAQTAKRETGSVDGAHSEPALPAPNQKSELVNGNQIALFLRESRQRQMIRDNDGETAWAWLMDMTGAKPVAGKTSIENIVLSLKKCTQKQFNEIILPGVRSI